MNQYTQYTSKFNGIKNIIYLILVVSLLLNGYFLLMNQKAKSEISKYLQTIKALNKDYEKLYDGYYRLENKLNLLQNSTERTFQFYGNQENRILIVQPSDSSLSYLYVIQLEPLPEGMIYRLWKNESGEYKNVVDITPNLKSYEWIECPAIISDTLIGVTREKRENQRFDSSLIWLKPVLE